MILYRMVSEHFISLAGLTDFSLVQRGDGQIFHRWPNDPFDFGGTRLLSCRQVREGHEISVYIHPEIERHNFN